MNDMEEIEFMKEVQSKINKSTRNVLKTRNDENNGITGTSVPRYLAH